MVDFRSTTKKLGVKVESTENRVWIEIIFIAVKTKAKVIVWLVTYKNVIKLLSGSQSFSCLMKDLNVRLTFYLWEPNNWIKQNIKLWEWQKNYQRLEFV